MILALDSATEVIYLAVFNDTKSFCVAIPSEKGKRHSALLMASINTLFEKHNLDRDQIQGVVCGVGPGGFTSLRVGVATAEGLAVGGLPSWSFTSFELRHAALNLDQHIPLCWIALEGQRGDLFVQPWSHEAPLAPATLMSIQRFKETVGQDPWWVPNSVSTNIQNFTSPLSLSAQEEVITLQGLVDISRLKIKMTPQKPLVPIYIRETDAEIHLRSSRSNTSSLK